MKAGVVSISLGVIAKIASSMIDYDDGSMKSITFKDFKKSVKTGDLIITSSSNIITRTITSSQWTHCGIAYVASNGIIYEWSSHDGKESLYNSRGIQCNGSQLIPLDVLYATYGCIMWRSVNITGLESKLLCNFVRNAAYKFKFSDMTELTAYCGLPTNGYGGGYACSHLVAATYATAGVIKLDRNISSYSPATFSDTGDCCWIRPESVAPTRLIVGFDCSRMVTFKK